MSVGVSDEALMTPGKSLWRVEKADRMTVIVDAEDYFRAARQAMLGAKRRILLIGWDFDARIVLDHDHPQPVGAFIHALVERNPQLEVFLLRWDVGALKTLGRGSTFFTVLKWMRHPRIHTKLDGHHPTGASHHQKIVIVDDCLAFCGGIDMTADRWDTRGHLDDDPRRRRPSTRRRYKPWHDAISAVSGPAAHALGVLFRERWRAAGGSPALLPDEDRAAPEPCWPEGLPVDFEQVDVGIARTIPGMDDQAAAHESEALFLEQIAGAKRQLYVESQYFASRRIAEAIARRLDEADGPEIVIVNPVTAQGWLEPLAMDTARARLMEALRRRDRHGRLRMYHPYTAGGAPIYVHAKILVADTSVLRLGSSNMNNRSMRLDTECDVAIAPEGERERGCVRRIRDGLIAEHLGLEVKPVAAAIDAHGLIGAIERLRGEGKTLRPYEVPDLSVVEAWLADNEVLDPEGPEEMFEPLSGRGLFRGRLSRRGR